MNKYVFLPFILFSVFSCKTGPGTDRQYAGDNEKRFYKLKLNPIPGSEYKYEIINESRIQLKVDDKNVNNINKSEVTVLYTLNKDSSGNLLLTMKYSKVHVFSKNGDIETDVNTDRAATTDDPVEKMVGVLKDAVIEAVISPTGEVMSVKGYDEIADKIIADFTTTDIDTKRIAKTTWQQAIGEAVVKKNIDQLFRIFPDSAVRVGDKWKINSRQEGQLGFNLQSFFSLKRMNDEIATISSTGEITSDNAEVNLSGNSIGADLKGTQDGEYQLEIKTGMTSEAKTSSEIEGTLQMMGREIPVTVTNMVKIKGKRIK